MEKEKDLHNMASYSLQSGMNIKEVITLCETLGKPFTSQELKQFKYIRSGINKTKQKCIGF
jgi:hypothetical protein